MATAQGEAKVALVTGSSSGIGETTAKLLSQKGYKLVVTGSKKEKVERVAAECVDLSPQKFQPLALVLDLSQPDNGDVAVAKTIEHFGRLDVLINNAGVFCKSPAQDPKSYDTYRRTMTINTDASVRTTLAAIEHLKASKGNIVFVSSVASTKPAQHGFAYCMSKASMTMFAKCLAVDLAPDVRVNVVSPGPVLTPIFEGVGLNAKMAEALLGATTLRNTIGTTDEIAKTIAFLASDDASFVNGHEMYVDGGYMLKPSTSNVDHKILAALAAEKKG